MADKLNMSLDEIIKMKNAEKKKEQQKSGPKGGNKGRAVGNRTFPGKNLRAAAAKRALNNAKNVKAAAAFRNRKTGPQKRVAAGGLKSVGNKPVNQATKKYVQKLVKNALRKRTNLTTNAVIRKRGGVAPSTLAARQRSTIIRKIVPQGRNVARRISARPAQRVTEVVQPGRVIRQVITAPPAPPRRVIRQAPQQQRTVIIQRVQRPQQQRRQVIRQVVTQPRRQQVVRREIVAQPRRVQVQRVRRPQYERVVEQVVRPQRQQNFRRAGGRVPQQVRTVVRQAPQYRPVQYITEKVVTRRGRGFAY